MGASQSYSAAQVPDLTGKVAIVTGASTGIGKITATELARKGIWTCGVDCFVFFKNALCKKDVLLYWLADLKRKRSQWWKRSRRKREMKMYSFFFCDTNLMAVQVTFLELNLASLQSVEQFAKEFTGKNKELHILVNNAGVMACPFTLSEDGIELQFATNHLVKENC